MTVIPMDLPQAKDPNAPEPLTDDELRGIVAQEIESAINHSTSEIAQRQQRALEYYRGDLFGNEVPGHSKVVLRDVAETVDWALPALMRAMFQTSEIVRYEDTTPESEMAGHGARMTKVINDIFRNKLRGLRLSHDWAKAGLLEEFSAVKFWIDRLREPTIPQIREGVPVDVLAELDSMPDVEILEATPRDDGLFDVKLKSWRTFFRMNLKLMPPEEFLISSRETCLDQSVSFVAHQRQMTRSDLYSLQIPWDMIARLSPSNVRAEDGRAVARQEDNGPDLSITNRRDKASQTVNVCESYIRVDYDGDGYSELRRVLTGGDNAQVLLDHDYAPMHGFAGWTPIPMPHQLYGQGYFVKVSDLQEIRSTLARQLLDNIYRMNHARHAIVEGEVDMDSYLDTAAGAPVMVERQESIAPLATPALPPWSFEALSYFEKVREQRTGIHPYSQESYAAGQNQTAQGVSTVFEAAMAQVQLLCQMFGSGLEDLFRIIPRMMRAAGMGPDRIKVGDEWIDYNPQEWPDEMRVSVQVGLSPGQTEQRIQRLMLILGLQEKALALGGPGYMVTPEQFFATAVRIVEQSGFQNPGAFFTSPQGKPIPQTPPPPEQIKVETEAKDKQAMRALDLSKLEMDREHKREQEGRLEREAQEKYRVERENIAATERAQRYSADRQFEAALLQQQAQLAEAKATATATATAEAQKAGDTSQINAALAEISGRLGKLEEPKPRKRKVVKRNEQGLIIALEDEEY